MNQTNEVKTKHQQLLELMDGRPHTGYCGCCIPEEFTGIQIVRRWLNDSPLFLLDVPWPDGDDRLAEILTRYDPDSIVGRSMLRAEPVIRAAIDRTRLRMADASAI